MNQNFLCSKLWWWCRRTLGPEYAWERTLKKFEILDIFHYHKSLYPRRDGQTEHMLVKALKWLHSGYLGSNFVFFEKNNARVLRAHAVRSQPKAMLLLMPSWKLLWIINNSIISTSRWIHSYFNRSLSKVRLYCNDKLVHP